MRLRTLLLCLCLLGTCVAEAQIAHSRKSATSAVPSKDVVAVLGKRVPELMEVADIPGISLALVSNGKPYWSHSFGIRSASSREPVTEKTVFEAASLSKPVFAYAVMKLVDQGKLNLDTPLSEYLDKSYLSDRRIDQITARYVLSHRTGFPNWRPEGGELMIKVTPGERFSYSGEGFVYLAKVVERITGMPFEKLMEKQVFEPLGMSSSSYVWRDDYETRIATGHDAATTPRDKGKPKSPNAAASLHTTAEDYAKFISAVVNGTGLQSKSWNEMLLPQVAVDPACTNCTDRTASPHLSKEIFWGLGWGIERTIDGEFIWHWGDNGSFRCFVMAYPKRKTGIVMFTNSENGLLIAKDVVELALGGRHPAIAWIDYGSYDSPDFRFAKALQVKSAEDVIAATRLAEKEASLPSERTINSAGYRLLSQKRTGEAIRIFEWNVELHPKSGNVYDSLGEAYMTAGNKEAAIKNYERSLELDPQNNNAVKMLKKLRH